MGPLPLATAPARCCQVCSLGTAYNYCAAGQSGFTLHTAKSPDPVRALRPATAPEVTVRPEPPVTAAASRGGELPVNKQSSEDYFICLQGLILYKVARVEGHLALLGAQQPLRWPRSHSGKLAGGSPAEIPRPSASPLGPGCRLSSLYRAPVHPWRGTPY